MYQTYRFIFIRLLHFQLIFVLLWRRLLKLLLEFLRVLEEERVSEAGAQEEVAGLHGNHLQGARPRRETSVAAEATKNCRTIRRYSAFALRLKKSAGCDKNVAFPHKRF